ncbi:hypothetical protein Y032_0020g15 [Ancylostoma ceylanicum]|uniref:Uncharacterized protein n=1 Tax=Ancylostoma ceylanicum TaxID=53326 RepID=A0A016UZV5_9BILA|nr:hypothetical protein Y032_0020g15 [Ancylostoma ceylanicum]
MIRIDPHRNLTYEDRYVSFQRTINAAIDYTNEKVLCQISKKYSGRPFKLASIQPVDMFPQTPHIEWVVTLDR